MPVAAKLMSCCILLLFSSTAFSAAELPSSVLEIGVVPYVSARVLVSSYEPMRRYLEKKLGMTVIIYTATGFQSFFMNARRGDYDLVISSAHFARILQKDHQFIPLARYAAGGRALLMAASNSRINSPQNLRGQVIAVPDKLSLSAIVFITYLREAGLKAGIDYSLLETPSFASAILSVQKGDATAAISAAGALGQMPSELRESVKPVIDAGEFSSLIFLAHPHLGEKASNTLKQALLDFPREAGEGKQFFSSNGFGSIIPVSTNDMLGLDKYISETKRLMEAVP